MKYLYYQSEKGNFGDDLNAWLWPQLIHTGNSSQNTYFLGIGSILYNKFRLLESIKQNQKIVFGSGIRPAHDTFRIDSTWDIKFLRGPLSSMSMQNRFEYIADAAYAIRLINNFERFQKIEKKYKIAVMPYFKSIKYFNWQKICDELGFYYINPESRDIEDVLNKIAASEYLITEAMHGAILADILRVPWHRFVLSTPFTEGQMVSEFKWMDWQYSMNLGSVDISYIKFYQEFFVGKALSKSSSGAVSANFFLKNKVRAELIECFSRINRFSLSGDDILRLITERMNDKLMVLHKEFA